MRNAASVEVELARNLLARGFSHCDEFLSAESLDVLRRCFDVRRRRGEFSAAGIGAAGRLQHRPDLRGDTICWLQEPMAAAEREALQFLERLRAQINAQGILGLWDIEAHYACYAPGACYARHVDRPAGTNRRLVSFALYLNSGWQARDGGELRLYDGADLIAEFAPAAGKLVCFLSADREHEVVAATRERASLTGWFSARA